ncbi:hypothetical protein F4604DRAFT_1956764 [Suillus subluteus]|nr:hypothetical protein F4604DRAFT_1956764 [Suillus subluteus]
MPGSLKTLHTTFVSVSLFSLSIYNYQRKKSQSPFQAHSLIGILSSAESSVAADTVILSLDASPVLSLEIKASSFELRSDIGQWRSCWKISWDALLDHGNEPFDISFSSVRSVHPSLTLKTDFLRPCNSQDSALLDSVVEYQITRDTDHFHLVLDQCPVGHPHQAAALTNLSRARSRQYLQDIDSITSLFREVLALPLIWRYSKENTAMMKTRVTPSFAAIGQSSPSTGQNKAFLAHDSELELVRKLVPATANPITLSGDDATRAGHSTLCNDREQPYCSRFAMKDEPLTLLDIMENDTPQAEFAFLSACHTTVGDEKSPDEVIHFAVGLQFSGFKVSLKLSFYENMFKDLEDGVMYCTKAAWALNRVTCAVKTKVLLEQRMVFIYVGV